MTFFRHRRPENRRSRRVSLCYKRQDNNKGGESGTCQNARGVVARAAVNSVTKIEPRICRTVGGKYKPLSEAECRMIFETACELLDEVGMGSPIPAIVEAVTGAGGRYDEEHHRVHFPRKLIDWAIETAAKEFTLHGYNPDKDLQIGGERVHFGTAGAAVHIYNTETNNYDLSHLVDLYDLGRLAHNAEHLHFFLRPIVARDMETARDLDINTAYAVMSATDKPVASSFFAPEHVDEVCRMADVMLGGEGRFRERPFLHSSNTFVVPPLRFAEESCECLVAQVRNGMTIMAISAGQAGATSPAALAGSLAQALAEVLSALVFVNILSPGHPVALGMWPFVSDLRTGAMSGGSGEEALMGAASAQLLNWLGLPSSVAAGMADSKRPDNQAGYEKGVTVTLAAQAGGNMIYESCSMLASLLASCKEAFVIDNDMLGMINRTVRGIDVNEESLSKQVIRETVYGPGHFLGSAQTLELMQREYLYPILGDRSSPKEWAEKDKPLLIPKARDQVHDICSSYFPTHIPLKAHKEIQENFPVKLDIGEITGASKRWTPRSV